MSIECNILELELDLARKKMREQQALYDDLREQTEAALKAMLDATEAFCTIEAKKRTAVQMADDLAGKRGPSSISPGARAPFPKP